MITYPPFEILERPWGNVLELHVPWDAEIEKLAEDKQIRGLSVGPKNRDLSFLSKFSDIESFSYLHDKGIDTAPIHQLTNLRRLYFANVSGPKVDFKAFPKLEECSMEWTNAVSGVFDATTLRKLYIGNLPKVHFPRVANLLNLEDLTLLGGQPTSLDWLGALIKLRRLRIARMKELEDISGLSNLTHLKELVVQSCSCFASLDALGSLVELEHLTLENVGPVESLAPLSSLNQLKTLDFYGDPKTRVVDGGLAPTLSLPNLQYLRVTGKNGVTWSAKRDGERLSQWSAE